MTMPEIIAFTIPGNPIPKARARGTVDAEGNTYYYTPGRTKHWEAQVKDAARLAMAGRAPLMGPVGVELWLWRGDKRRADADNCEKSILDACNGVLWMDDDQVMDMHRYKRLDRENPRAKVKVWELVEVEW